MTVTRINPALVTETVTVAKSLPSGASGDIFCYKRAGIAFVQLDGLTVPNTGWATYATGLPGAFSRNAWMQIITDDGVTVKAYVTTSGSLNIRKTSSATAYVDSIFSYPHA